MLKSHIRSCPSTNVHHSMAWYIPMHVILWHGTNAHHSMTWYIRTNARHIMLVMCTAKIFHIYHIS